MAENRAERERAARKRDDARKAMNEVIVVKDIFILAG